MSGFNFPVAYDTSRYNTQTWTAELRLQSNWVDSPWDFIVGSFYMNHETNDSEYDVRFNTGAFLAPVGFAPGPEGQPAPVSFFRSDTNFYDLDTWAGFGEVYFDVTPRTRITAGLRYTWENKALEDRQSLLNDIALPVTEVSNRAFLNGSIAPLVGALAAGGVPQAQQLNALYTDPAANGLDPAQVGLFQGFGVGGNNPIPAYRPFTEDWEELTGKLGVEHDMTLPFTDETMAFLTLSRSYKSGGINPPSFTGAFEETFDPEYINSIEVGAKNRMMDGRMQLNFTYFFYDYESLQVTKIIDRGPR